MIGVCVPAWEEGMGGCGMREIGDEVHALRLASRAQDCRGSANCRDCLRGRNRSRGAMGGCTLLMACSTAITSPSRFFTCRTRRWAARSRLVRRFGISLELSFGRPDAARVPGGRAGYGMAQDGLGFVAGGAVVV
jgi:hypothetical protein